MAFYFPEGSVIAVSRTFGAAKPVTALTNASPPVASAAGHGLVDGDVALYRGGWEDYDESAVVVDQTDVNTVSLLGMNTTNTSFYTPGSGTGTLEKVTDWITVPQVTGITSSGGGPRFTNVQLLARRNAISIPTGFESTTITLTLAHDPGDENYQELLDISRSGDAVAIKVLIGGGAVLYGFGYFSVSEMPSLQVGQVNTVQAAMTLNGRPISYDL